MDGRNVGGSNSGASGRPKLVRSGISLQRENTPFGSGSAKSGQNVQGSGVTPKQTDVASVQKPPGSSSLNPGASFLSGRVIGRPSSIASSSQKSLASVEANKEAKSSISSGKGIVEESAKVITATMSEGLSSLVSYSSSSAEASASEDNGQEEQDDLSLVASSQKAGSLSGTSSDALVKKMELISNLQKSSKEEQQDSGLSEETKDSVSSSGDMSVVKKPEKSMVSANSESKKVIVLLDDIMKDSKKIEEKVSATQSKERPKLKFKESGIIGGLKMHKEEHVKETEIVSQKAQKVDTVMNPAKKETQADHKTTTDKTSAPPLAHEQISVRKIKIHDSGRRSSSESPQVGRKPGQIESGLKKEVSHSGSSDIVEKKAEGQIQVLTSELPSERSKTQMPRSNVSPEKSQTQMPASNFPSTALQQDKPIVPTKEAAAKECSKPSALLESSDNTKGILHTSATKDTPLHLPAAKQFPSHMETSLKEATTSSLQEPLLPKDETIPLDLVEERLKLLTEGDSVSDLDIPDLEESLSNITTENLLGKLDVHHEPESDYDVKEMVAEGQSGLSQETDVPLISQTPPAEQKEVKTFENILPKKDEVSHTNKEVVNQSTVVSASQSTVMSTSQSNVTPASQGTVMPVSQSAVMPVGQSNAMSVSHSSVVSTSQNSVVSSSHSSVMSLSENPVLSAGQSTVMSNGQSTVMSVSQNVVMSASENPAMSASQTSVISGGLKDTPMEIQDVSDSPVMPIESNVSESLSSCTSEEGKEADVIALVSEQKGNMTVKSEKRSYSDDGSSEGVYQKQKEPQEKRQKLEEKDVFVGQSVNQGIEQMVTVPKTAIERMEEESCTTPMEVLPTFEKLSEDLAASKNLGMKEESKNSVDDSSEVSSPFKDIAEGKDKEELKEEEALTASSKKKRKKKSYERPRGEGGKFRKERPGRSRISDPSLLDEDTRMDGNLPQDEDSQGSSSKREVRRFRCEVIVPESTEAFTADKVVEYVWPLEGCGEHYFIQEQISQYLGIMSFKRKYPDLRRRPLEMQERDYLKDKGLVSEMACDLGLTAVRSEDVLDVMLTDFPHKFEELQRLLRERKENEMKERGKVSYSMATLDKSKMQEYLVKAAEDSARWNAAFNREKREERRYSFDLQTCSLQMPRGRHKKLSPEATKLGAYPVAVLPGQYTDFYREYTPIALKSMPLNTVMSSPMNNDSLGSDGAGSESEEEPAASLPPVDVPDTTVVKDEKIEGLPRCKVCAGSKNRNKAGEPEPLIICGNCRSASHPTCIDLTLVMVPKIESYNWQCMDCKSCVTCNNPDDEDKMIFCDMCDRGYHIYCVGLRRVPNGRWHCKECAICSSCGSKTPAGCENAKNAEWQHEFKKDKNDKQLKYATTLCVPCDKYWKRRQFCYVCLKVYRSIPEDGMVRCSNCPKYIHREGCSTIYENERFCNNCYKIRNSTALNHSRIIAAAKKKMASGY